MSDEENVETTEEEEADATPAEGDDEASDSDAEADEAADEEEETALEDMSKADLISVAEERGVEVKKSWSRSKLLAALAHEEVPEAPVGELLPVIRPGMWVRFGSHKSVPNHLVGRDGVVLRALVKRAAGGDTISPVPYEYQDGSEEILVRARDSGEHLEVTRDAFAKFADSEAFLAAA